MTSLAGDTCPSVLAPTRYIFLTVLCCFCTSVTSVRADGCYTLEAGQAENLWEVEPSFLIAGSRTVVGTDADLNEIPIPTLSRLAILSGPFQSLRDEKVAKDPNCGRWGGRDKVGHAALFFASTLGLQLFIESTFNVSKTKAFILSATLSTLVGLGKEYYDGKISDKDCFSEQDLLANAAGIMSAGLVIMISK